jgi:2-polyprenyl-3-methyl-5-hydroxy-6-metoxy-1,4-benzoquinol methylase
MNSSVQSALLQARQKSCNVSDKELQDILDKLPDKNIWEYLSHKYSIKNNLITKESELIFLESYEKIRDNTWPNIDNIKDFANLPEQIKKECIEVHKFSEEIFYDSNIAFDKFQPSVDFSYNPDQLLRTKSVVLDNAEYITDKKVIDLCCSYGTMALPIACYNPRHLTLMDIRTGLLDLVNEAMCLLEKNPTTWHSVQADIHDYESNTQICKDQDTVFLCGLLYHVHDHFAILESITKACPDTIIIETNEKKHIKDLTEPIIVFEKESTVEAHRGFEKNKEEILVGHPNTAWLDTAMNLLGYNKIKPTKFVKVWPPKFVKFRDQWTSNKVNLSEESSQIRSVHVYQRQPG